MTAAAGRSSADSTVAVAVTDSPGSIVSEESRRSETVTLGADRTTAVSRSEPTRTVYSPGFDGVHERRWFVPSPGASVPCS